MKKIISRLIILLLTTALISIIYLSTIGIKTERFNDQISNQIKKIDKDLDIELKKVSILLDPIRFNVNAKTVGTNLEYRKKIIQIESIRSIISLKSIINNDLQLKNLKISTKSVELKNLISFLRFFKNDPKFFIAEKLIKKGYLIANINIEFDEDGNIKNNYEIKGLIKDGKINLFNKYDFSKIDLNFDLKDDEFNLKNTKLSFNGNDISIPNLKSKKENNNFLISGKIDNKKFILDENNLIHLLNDIFLNFKIEKVDFASKSSFQFKIDNKFKFKNLKIESIIDLNYMVLLNKLNLTEIFPDSNESIKLENHEIIFKYNQDNFEVEGFGKILLQNKNDEIKYKIKKSEKDFNFQTKFNIKDNIAKLDLLNFKKKPDTNLEIDISGNKIFNGDFFLEKVSLKEKENNISISKLLLTNENKIKEFEKINFKYVDEDSLKNNFRIIKKKNDYLLDGQILNLNKIIDEALKADKGQKDLFQNNIRLNVNIEKAYVDKESVINDLKGYLVFKNNEVINAKLDSAFSNNKKISFTVKSNNDEKITTFFSEYPKPLVKRYNFIKGFDEGVLDFYSIKKNNISNSVLIIDNFKLKEVPVLAKILTLASLQGIADLLTGEGIRFTDFEMKFNNSKGLMTIEEMYAIGPAISILLDGYIESDKLISLRGTLVPATTINRTIASIPLIGNILVGKKVGEGVFGVSFKIKGPPDDLEPSVNPIKTLTPRFITRTLEKIKKN